MKPEDVKPDVSYDSLGLDSLDLVELSVRIEDAYGIDIEEDDLKDVWTIDNAIDVVLTKLGQCVMISAALAPSGVAVTGIGAVSPLGVGRRSVVEGARLG